MWEEVYRSEHSHHVVGGVELDDKPVAGRVLEAVQLLLGIDGRLNVAELDRGDALRTADRGGQTWGHNRPRGRQKGLPRKSTILMRCALS